jgi:hypothetical protein
MTDRELLEAAYAAYRPGENYIRLINDAGSDYWNPLTDDGDALRLVVKLKMIVDVTDEASGAGAIGLKWCSEPYKDDPYAATRRAIVRAAAEIGKGLRPFPSDEEIRENWT